MRSNQGAGTWTVLLPLKSSRRGKSRILVDRVLRRRLVGAMAADTAAAAAAAARVRSVLIIAENAADAAAFDGIEGVVVRPTVADGLNTALVAGLTAVNGPGGVTVLLADLPSLTPVELDGALTQAEEHGVVVVPDRHGTGSTLLAAAPPHRLVPRFGPGSLARHVAAGAVALELPPASGLRRDVDCLQDLAGVTGSRTVAALHEAACRAGG